MALEQGAIINVLDWAYEKAVNTKVPGLESAQSLAESYLKNDRSIHEQVDDLIFWQNTKCATSGFLSGLGGLITLPVAVPANVSSVIYVQLRMVAAIAHMGGHDIVDDKVKTFAYTCLCGNAAKEVFKEVGIKIGQKVTEQAIQKVSVEIIKKINSAVGFRLVTKFGQSGIVNLGKAIPIVSGLIGATFDAYSSNVVGNTAREIFIG
ncbi:EcsC family protein [Heliobacterium chlorum]|uniref:EcsC family protein n=1 Tax=Heliobacterium chlorum TaxID=2698 RepID=A0ABR7T4Z8_HELCL|nr:EcsC family protein [Heliobacterium chlorum]MBC9785078.1 EcsC family protein [Heliobacterium chlorum]